MNASVREVVPTAVLHAEIEGGTVHRLRWCVPARCFGALEVVQEGIDVEIRLFSPESSEALLIVDGMSGAWGVERLSVFAETETVYGIEITPTGTTVEPGSYRVSATEPRVAGVADRRQVEAERMFDAAERLRRGGGEENARRALEKYREALEVFAETADSVEIGDFSEIRTHWRLAALQRVGWIWEILHDAERARGVYQELLDLSRRARREEEAVRTLNRLGRIDFSQGRYESAEAFFREALRGAEELGDRRLETICLNNHASLLYRREDLTGAVHQFMAAYEIWEELGDLRNQAFTLFNVGRVFQAQGMVVEAIDCLERSMRLRKRAGDADRVAEAAVQLGDVYRQAGRLQQARRVYRAGLKAKESRLTATWRVILLNGLGLIDAEFGELQDAADRFLEAAKESRKSENPRFEAIALMNLGDVMRRAGDHEKAVENVRRAREIFLRANDRRHLAACDLIEGLCRRDQGFPDRALSSLRTAVDRVETLRNEQKGRLFRRSFFSTRQVFFESLIDLLVQRYGEVGREDFLEEAFQFARRCRAGSLLDALGERRMDFQKKGQASGDQEEALTAELTQIEEDLRQAVSERAVALKQERRRVLLRLEAMRAESRPADPRYGELLSAPLWTIDEIRDKVLDDHTLLLAYTLGDRRSFLWCLDRRTPLQCFELPGREEIEGAVREARAAFTTPSLRQFEEKRGALEALAELILGPVRPLLNVSHVAVVPDGSLHLIPFAALPLSLEESEKEPSWLVEKCTVVCIPSVAALAALRSAPKHRPSRVRYDLTVFADPIFSREDDRLSGGLDESSEESHQDLSRTLRNLGQGPHLPRLAAAAREARRISEFVPEERRQVFLGFDACRENFEKALLEDSRILHFATHGVVDPQRPEFCGIVLSLVDRDGKPLNGWIRSHELSSRRLSADLVVLSACRTAVGKDVRGDGMIGLQRGFFDAGVARVIAGLWNVDDLGAARLMSLLYEELAEGASPADALRFAQMKMIDSEDSRYGLPYFWGALTFYGDWRNLQDFGTGIGEAEDGGVVLADPEKGASYSAQADLADVLFNEITEREEDP